MCPAAGHSILDVAPVGGGVPDAPLHCTSCYVPVGDDAHIVPHGCASCLAS